ncbi:nitrate- and nitrite sensing domain-containing protein [Kitasatospora sp. NBC_01287]|uniref:sensor histidine kinase n=1 Tax=Kitasatospora sp. NBC_01287 TaxID=2903573 RepID=UPI00225B7B64|nr:nitrate- and nitrite sensing domain-containing protein [Kitasatospora sp. NBC_01287]MCX4745352.1 nitrate- and nitrite sensing domain-containing protein [Kitasatospora sp. NBC_01287]
MRLRSSSIRAKIIALLLVPIVALVGLWAYATLVTTSDFWNQLNVASTYKAFGAPVDQVARDLQDERRAAVVLLARPQASDVQTDYLNAQKTTDQDLALLRQKAGGSDAGKLSSAERARLQDVLSAAGQLTLLRGQVGQQSISWGFAITQYSGLILPAFGFRSAFVSQQSGQLPRQGTILIELTRAREYLSQQDAAMEGMLASAVPTLQQEQAVLDPMHDQQALFEVYIGELDQPDQSDYLALQGSDDWRALDLADREFESASEPADAVQSVSEATWRQTADRMLGDLSQENSKLADTLGARATSYAMGLLWRGLVAGVIGLLAIVLSVVISLRIGRGLVRELIGLRNAAHDLAGARLPSVMRRLRDGQPVDIAAEAPELQFGDAEIGQVGRAFNQVQRAAVRAAVEQAELRRGVSAVFVNLARRSQVLLHRQLTLLDTMERRTEDPAELEDLFKLDHLTTRMRRHAEGLIILSGGSPGRAWRKPVRMVDVVRAAVGEVEDYARVIVRPFPGTGLLGSAVADVTHLIAELVENAAVFSPPQTQVTVQGEVVAHGFALEIDDRGLGLSEPALAEINQRLEVEQAFDLTDTDRLGLFVVSRLARRHGVRVSLRASPYGGTTAVVLIPRELLAEVPGGVAVPPGAVPVPGGGVGAGAAGPAAMPRQRDLVAVTGGAATGSTAGRAGAARTRGAHQRPVTGPQPAGAEPARTPGGLPRRRATGGPVLVPAPGGTGRHRRQGLDVADADGHSVDVPGSPDVSAASDAPDALGAPPAAGGLLPRRVRQANLAPQLKEAAARAADRSAEPQSVRERSPEEARATFSSFQRGFSRGRAAPSPTGVPPDPGIAAGAPLPGTEPPLRPLPPAGPLSPAGGRRPLPDVRRALAASPVPPALPAAPRPAPPASAEGPDR